MATKQQVLKRIQQVAPGATMEINDFPMSFQVNVEAPPDHRWSDGPHCLAMPEWYSGKRSECWDIVLEVLEDQYVVRCEDDPCEGIRDHDECEYWLEEQE